MKNITNIVLTACLLLLAFRQDALAQAYNQSLSMQGVNQTTIVSASSRAMGGITMGLKNNVAVMFSNPAALHTIDGVQISVGALQQDINSEQTQQWFPMAYYSNFSLLMQDLTRNIPDPDTIRNNPPNAGDSVQRPFDGLGPDWNHSKHQKTHIQGFIGAPFELGGIKFAAGLGITEYANLNYFYQNNNVLSPDFGSYRSGIFILPPSDRDLDAIPVYWYQTVRERVGSIYGYGGAVSAELSGTFSLGFSAMLLDGTTDDYESVTSRGVLRMHRNFFGLYRYQNDTSKVGKSDYSGFEYTISGLFNRENFTLGFALQPSATITRKYNGSSKIDTTGNVSISYEESGTDKIKLPWRGTIGIGATVRQNITIGVEYEFLPFGSAAYSNDSSSLKPWLDCSSFRVGFEYLPLPELTLRAGYFTKAEVFEPESNYNTGEAVSSSGYSGGFGVNIGDVHFNLAYEYLKVEYEDKWSTNINLNSKVYQNFAADVAYKLPW